MVQHRAVSPPDAMRTRAERDEHATTSDDRALALLLITAWATRTRRVLRPVPVSELAPAELVNFWADDQLEQPLDSPVREWPHLKITDGTGVTADQVDAWGES